VNDRVTNTGLQARNRFFTAIWGQFAGFPMSELNPAQASKCARWSLKSAGRDDRRFCSHPRKMRSVSAGQEQPYVIQCFVISGGGCA
jgi:hypothetical protein